MALFKISKGSKSNLPSTLTEGYCWYTFEDSKFYIDHKDENGVLVRKALNAQDAATLCGKSLEELKTEIMGDIDIPEYSAAGTALGLVKSGGDVDISDGVISVKGNVVTEDVYTKYVTIKRENGSSVQENLVNDSFFVGEYSNCIILAASMITGDSSEDCEYDATEEGGIHYDSGKNAHQIIPYEVLFDGNVPAGKFECILTSIDFYYIEKDGVIIEPEFIPPTSENGKNFWSMAGISEADMYFNDDGFVFFMNNYQNPHEFVFAPWIHFRCIVKGSEQVLDTKHLTASVDSNGLMTVTAKNTTPNYSTYNSINATIQYTAAFGSDLNVENEYPYFNNLATNTIKPIIGDDIRPEITHKYNFGSPENHWKTIYADSLDGTAAMAIADAAGNDIQATYAKKSEIGNTPGSGSSYTLPTASSTTLGGVKIGPNITHSSGTISLTKTNVTNALDYTPAKEDHTHDDYLVDGGSASFSELIVNGDFVVEAGSNFELGEGVVLSIDGVNVGDTIKDLQNRLDNNGIVGTWVFNEELDITLDGEYYVSITKPDSGTEAEIIGLTFFDQCCMGLLVGTDGNYIDCYEEGWIYGFSRVMTFTGEPDNQELVDWVKANAKRYESTGVDQIAYIEQNQTVDSIGYNESGIFITNTTRFLDGNDAPLAEAGFDQCIPIVAGNNVTFEVDEENKVVKINATGGGESTTETDIFPLQTVSGFVEDTDFLIGTYFAYSPTVFEIKEGETYYVEWDGETYTCEGIVVDFPYDESTTLRYVYLGNGSKLGYPHNNEPFAVIYMADFGKSEFLANDNESSHDIRVYQKSAVSSIPVRGVDYWTEEDKAEIKAYVDDAILNGAW